MLLIINSGSTSLKYALLKSADFELIKKENLEIKRGTPEEYSKAFRELMRQIGDVSQIKAVGHRVVHGGTNFIEPTVIDQENIKLLEELNSLAPLHNPYNILGIKTAHEYFPSVPNIAVFDTSFYKDLPEEVKIYPLPYKYYSEYGIQKFGFHGTSHKYASQAACEQLGKPFDKAKIISLHLGGGCSITAINKGKPIDTSMGFTPLEGLPMMTRTGDLDPGIILKILQDNIDSGLDPQDIVNKTSNLLNHQSGLKGLSGFNTYLDLLKSVKAKDPQSNLAFNIFIHRIKKYIGAYYAILGEPNAIVFTGAIGAGDRLTRNKVMEKMDFLKDTPVLAIPANEELAIAKEINKITNK